MILDSSHLFHLTTVTLYPYGNNDLLYKYNYLLFLKLKLFLLLNFWSYIKVFLGSISPLLGHRCVGSFFGKSYRCPPLSQLCQFHSNKARYNNLLLLLNFERELSEGLQTFTSLFYLSYLWLCVSLPKILLPSK